MSARRHVRPSCADEEGSAPGATDGFILVAVLWILGALAALSSVYAIYIANSAVTAAVGDDEVRAQALTSGALELAAFRLLAAPEEHRPRHGAFDMRMGRARVAVQFLTEAARIDLNAAPKKVLAGLFTALGAQTDDADQYADRVVGWRSPATPGAQDREASLYRAAGRPYGPRGAPFVDTGELPLVLGLPPALVERALPYVTVFSGQADVNILEAAPEVIAALPGMTPQRLAGVLAERATIAPGDSAAAVLGLVQNAATMDRSRAVRVTVEVVLDNGRRIRSEAVILVDGKDAPFHVLSWQDDLPQPRAGLAKGASR